MANLRDPIRRIAPTLELTVSLIRDARGLRRRDPDNPTWTGHLAEALVEVAERDGDVGVFHAAGAG